MSSATSGADGGGPGGLFDSGDPSLYTFDVITDDGPGTGPGDEGRLPLEADRLASMSSGELFGWTQNVAMGLNPKRLASREFLILSTLGGLRAADGSPIALGYHTGHWELGLLIDAAARELTDRGAVPFAGHVSDPCDGRSNGTEAMLDSLPYRNDAAVVLRRLARSLPGRAGLLGVATCDKGLPAMLMALAGLPELPSVVVPGGVTLLSQTAVDAGEDTGSVQSLAARFARGEITLEHAQVMGCQACGSAGGGCQFLGTAATSQVIAEALGLTLPHAALHPSGTDLWLDLARRSARALIRSAEAGRRAGDVVTDDSVHNALVTHAAVGARPTSTSTSRPSPTPPGSTVPGSRPGGRSTPRSPAWPTPSQTGRRTTPPSTSSWPAGCPRSCSGWPDGERYGSRLPPCRGSASATSSTGGRGASAGPGCGTAWPPSTASTPTT